MANEDRVELCKQPDQPANQAFEFGDAEQIRITMRQVTRRQRWLWSTGVMVTILLTVGIASFAFPRLLVQPEDSSFYQFNLNLAVRGLVGLVLLFIIYVIYQQLQIHRIQLNVDEQIGRVEERTQQVYKIAGRDGLTDLYNRQLGEERLLEEMGRSQRHASPLTLLRLDVHGLAEIKDDFGQISGDHTIRYFAKCLQKAVRGCDVPIRVGPSGFLILLPECKNAQAVLNRLSSTTQESGEGKFPLRFTTGWTNYVAGEPSDLLLLRVENALRKHNDTEENASTGNASVPPTDGAAINALTQRERQVFQLLVQCKTNKEVAGALRLSVRTVETYRAKIMAQLNVHSISELIHYAIRNNLLKN